MSIYAYDYGIKDGRQEREDEIVDALKSLKTGNEIDDLYLDAIIKVVIDSGKVKQMDIPSTLLFLLVGGPILVGIVNAMLDKNNENSGEQQ